MIEGHHHSDAVDETIWNELAKDLNRNNAAIKQRWIILQRGLKDRNKVNESKIMELKKDGKYDDDENAIIRRN